MPEQRNSGNYRRKDFMINNNESDMHRPGIKPGSPDLQSNALYLPTKLTGRFLSTSQFHINTEKLDSSNNTDIISLREVQQKACTEC
jgi:hypothetical protein